MPVRDRLLTAMEREPPVLRPLEAADIPGALRLKDLAGWNQVAEDWRLFLDLAPGGAFALEHRGEVIATSTAIPHGGEFGWVGMMLVHPGERRKGHGARMLEAALAFLDGRGCPAALDATAMGRPLYERYGFREIYPVERWTGPAPAAAVPSGCHPLGPAGLDEVLPLDRASFGADRGALLRGLLEREGSRGFLIDDADGIAGFVLVRRGSRFTHVGPWVARSPGAAEALFWAALAGIPPGGPAGVDVPAPNGYAREILRRAGLAPARTLWRMAREGKRSPEAAGDHEASPIPPGGRPDRIHGLAGLEWG